MNQIGRKLYFDLAVGNVLVDTGERMGNVVETTQEQDFEAYAVLTERLPETVGCLQLAFGDFAQDFAECNGFMIDVTGDTPSLVFSYPDPDDPGEPPVYRKPLSQEVDDVKVENADLKSRLADVELALADLFTGGA